MTILPGSGFFVSRENKVTARYRALKTRFGVLYAEGQVERLMIAEQQIQDLWRGQQSLHEDIEALGSWVSYLRSQNLEKDSEIARPSGLILEVKVQGKEHVTELFSRVSALGSQVEQLTMKASMKIE